MSSDEHIVFEIMAFIGKKTLEYKEKLRRKLDIQVVKKLYNLDEKIKKKTGGVLINENPPKLDKEMRKKINHLLLCILLCRK